MYSARLLTTKNAISDFDSLFREMDSIFESTFPQVATSFPPTNLEKTQDGYIIEMALAGYGREDISVSQEGETLIVSAEKQRSAEREDTKNIYRGIRASAFTKKFTLDKSAEVTSVTLTDGILTVNIRQAAPELKKLNFEIK